MPRKPKPPLTNLHIESLSTGQRIDLVDEFTGEVIPQPSAKPPKSSEEYIRERSQQRIAQAQQVLKQAGWYADSALPTRAYGPFKRRL